MAHIYLNDRCGQGSRECHVVEDYHSKTNEYHGCDGEVNVGKPCEGKPWS
jgi:hypothetical protein